MSIALREKLCCVKRALLFHNAMHEKMIFPAEEDNVTAPHIVQGYLPD
jgi:hypothetical protein